MPMSYLEMEGSLMFLFRSPVDSSIALGIVKKNFRECVGVSARLGKIDESVLICSFPKASHDAKKVRRFIEESTGGTWINVIPQ